MTITKEGSLTSFYTVNKAPIKHLKVYFSPKQVGSGEPSPENVREIDGWNGCQCIIGEKNLFDATTVNLITGMYRSDTGIETSTENSSYTASTYEINTNKILYIKPNNVTKIRIYFLDQNKNWISRSKQQSIVADWGYLQFNPANFPNNTKYIQIQCSIDYDISKLIMCYGDDAIDINWTSSPGTVYGGYVDLITGELVQEWIKFSATWNTFTKYPEYSPENYSTRNYTLDTTVYGRDYPQYNICNIAPTVSTNDYTAYSHCFMSRNGTQLICVLPDNLNENTIIECALKLQTPIIHQLTPIQLRTFIGQNNIWSNADRVEVEYDLAESNDELYRRRNIILQGAPHLESVSSNIANFNTDLAAPIKDVKIYFNPIQEGSGDSSPENVRSINGWTESTIFLTRTNIWDEQVELGSLSTVTGEKLSSTSQIRTKNYVPVKSGAEYCIVLGSTTGIWTLFYDKNKQLITDGLPNGKEASRNARRLNNGYKLIIPDKCVYIKWYFQISYGTEYNNDTSINYPSSDTIYHSYTGAIIPVDWSSEVGTVYGGYIDLINGEIVQEWQKVMLTETMNYWNSWGGNRLIYNSTYMNDGTSIYNHGKRMAGTEIYSNILTPIGGTIDPQKVTLKTEIRYYGMDARYPQYFFVAKNEDETLAEWRQWFQTTYSDAYVIYKLQTPIHHPLTPQTLKTLKGTNNIWSDANGPVEIKYWTH